MEFLLVAGGVACGFVLGAGFGSDLTAKAYARLTQGLLVKLNDVEQRHGLKQTSVEQVLDALHEAFKK